MPERNSSTTEATVQMPYSSGETANGAVPVAFAISIRYAPRKRPYWKRPEPKPMPPSAHGPIKMPTPSSPNTLGNLRSEANIPPSFAAKRISPI